MVIQTLSHSGLAIPVTKGLVFSPFILTTQRSVNFTDDLFQSVFKSKAFQELSEDALAEVLKDSGLNMDESEIIKYIKEWAAVNSVSQIQQGLCYMYSGFVLMYLDDH